jgi:hypothetical protein
MQGELRQSWVGAAGIPTFAFTNRCHLLRDTTAAEQGRQKKDQKKGDSTDQPQKKEAITLEVWW